MPDGGWVLNEGKVPAGDEPAAPDPITTSQEPVTVTAVILQLRWLWACYTIGAALHRMCPHLEDLDILSNSAALRDAVTRFAPLVRAMRRDMEGVTDLDAVARVGEQHYGDGLEALDELAQALDVPPDTLMTVLIHA